MPQWQPKSDLRAYNLPLLIVVGIGMLACFAGMTSLDHFTREGWHYLTYFGVAFGLYVSVAALVVSDWVKEERTIITTVLIVGIAFRMVLWTTQPTLSNDVWRYLWDGHCWTQRLNPYAERVNSPALDAYDNPVRNRVDNATMATPYPPGAEVVFGMLALISAQKPLIMQIAFSGFDVATGLVLMAFLQRIGLPRSRVLIYLWNPLIVVEFAHGAHVNSLMALCVVATLYFTIKEQHMWSMTMLALAALAKYVPVLLLPVFVRRWGWGWVIVFGALIAAAFAPFLSAGLGLNTDFDGRGIFGAARIYLGYWQTNDGLFYWLDSALSKIIANHFAVSQQIGTAVLVLVAGWLMLKTQRHDAGNSQRVIRASAVLISVYLLLSPAVFPWYLTWLIALLPLIEPSELPAKLFVAGSILFSGLVDLSYLTYLDPQHPAELPWVRYVEYLPVLTMMGAALIVWVRQCRGVRKSP